ncbi:DOMON domain-containing protein FRRS1L isoform X1 [Xenopus tropicalis]|uniref:DOMON domain-containing protein FRRS1L isoform X1 n=1 Tax=Xenopus tropicalis TaxID=8364 RepID=A0A8J0R3Y8_XENTR|nr:DOMON domain-containing protein FRRS1L isoform X1 [Xenopus tropicalis]|eukprot:XP_004915126.1 PREDICTED: DOMON domain-containing protein FRRS1L isoform X1 [Xenopus tropicalis]
MVLQCQSVGAWLLFAYAVSASPADESAVRGSRTDQGDQALDEKHQDTYGTFASEFYDLRYLSEEGYPFPTAPPVDPFARIRVDDCGKTKGCFRYGKPGCNAETCDYFLSYRRIGADVEFELSADTEGWVAVGFSSDKKMGGDDVMACVHDDNGRVRIQHFYNVGQWAKEIKRNPARDEEGVFENNRVTCRFKRPVYVPRDETIVDLHLSWYYLFAWGPAIQDPELEVGLLRGSILQDLRSCCCLFSTGRVYEVCPAPLIRTGMLAKVDAPRLGSTPHSAILKFKEKPLVGRKVREGHMSVAETWPSSWMRSRPTFPSSSSSKPRPEEREWPPRNLKKIGSTNP